MKKNGITRELPRADVFKIFIRQCGVDCSCGILVSASAACQPAEPALHCYFAKSFRRLRRRMQNVKSDGRPLFGGAMSAIIPHSAKDISELREIPDNQEIFAHCHTDQSFIVELLEFQSQVENENAARYHFEDIAGSNKALDPGTSEVINVVPLPKSDLSMAECNSAWVLTGTQYVSKFNEEAKNKVAIHLGLFRLPQFSTDVLVTFNDPLSINPGSSSAVGIGTQPTEPWTVQDFSHLLQSLTLHDPGVFG